MPSRQYLIADWQGSAFQKWAYNYCTRNQWRVNFTIGDFDDCLSECAVIYVECRRRYGETINTPQQFMRLFQLCVASWFNTQSVRDFNQRRYAMMMPKPRIEVQPDLDFVVKMDEASSELKEVVRIFLDAPKEIMDLIRMEATSHCPRQFFNAVLKYLKLDPTKSKPLINELKGILGGRPE